MEQENNKKEMGLEERFAAIELILDQMKAANQALDQIEKAMLVMNESGELEEF